jgi:type I restriction enzyme, R subunit
MPYAYTEDQLVEQPAIGLFAELGWATATAAEELFGIPASGLTSAPWTGAVSLGRETKGEVVLRTEPSKP